MGYNRSMKRRRNNTLSTAIGMWVIGLITKFIQEACSAGRTLELVISSISVGATYYFMFQIESTLPLGVYFVPFGIYVVYWIILLQHPKITSTKANPQWVNRDWWWSLDGWDFEEETAKVFRLNGYRATVTRKVSDGGVDLIMYKENKKIIVQCKHYSSPVGVSVARELNGLKDDFKADELILIASSGVTKSCREFTRNKPYFQILDLEDIIRMGTRPYSS